MPNPDEKVVDLTRLNRFLQHVQNLFAQKNGYYAGLTSGLSKNLDSRMSFNDPIAYLYRTMAGGEEVASSCKVKSIIGGSLGFNQLVNNGNFASVSGWDLFSGSLSVLNNIGTYTIGTNNFSERIQKTDIVFEKDHKYFITFTGLCSKQTLVRISNSARDILSWKSLSANTKTTFSVIFNSLEDTTILRLYCNGNNDLLEGDTFQYSNVMTSDLTATLGSTIANYIYSLEQATAGAGVAWFRRYFNKPYYPYTPIGGFVHVKTSGRKTTRFNQFNIDNLLNITGWSKTNNVYSGSVQNLVSAYYFAFVNNSLIKIPNGYSGRYQVYIKGYATSGSSPNIKFLYDDGTNSTAFTIGTTDQVYVGTSTDGKKVVGIGFSFNQNGTAYIEKFCISFYWDGERTGDYEDYHAETYPTDDVELIGIPKLDSNNNLTFEGNVYNSDGTIDENCGIVDLGTLNWIKAGVSADETVVRVNYALTDMKNLATSIVSGKGLTTRNGVLSVNDGANLVSTKTYNNYVYITLRISEIGWDGDDNTLRQAAQTYLSGCYLIYEKASVTQSSATAFIKQQESDNWGAENWLSPENDTRPCEVPVSSNIEYLPDLKAKLESAPSNPEDDGVYVMTRENGENSYTLLGTYLSDNDYTKDITKQAILDNIGGALRHQLASANSLDFNNTAWVDLGNLNWEYSGNSGRFYAIISNKNSGNNLLCPLYKTTLNEGFAVSDMCISNAGGTYVTYIFICNSNYTTDATAFKNAMKGILLAYEKASS